MRIATWNINGLRAGSTSCGYRGAWPDVVGLQELKISDEEFPTEFSATLVITQ
jgi:exonuclease III